MQNMYGRQQQQQKAGSREQRAPQPRGQPNRTKVSHTAFVTPTPAQREEWLAKALANAGVASRRACIELVKQGKVQVNGAIVDDPATKVDPLTDSLMVNGRRIVSSSSLKPHHFAVNKPAGYICSNVSKQPGRRAVDLLQPWLDEWQRQHKGQLPPRLFTVGRLDVATSGLLFITNDGDWANRVIHPSANIIKEYWATLRQHPTHLQLQALREGTIIDGVKVVPKLVRVRTPSATATAASVGAENSASRGTASRSSSRTRAGTSSNTGKGGNADGTSQGGSGRCVVQLEVSEGKKHEVRLLVAAAGLDLLQLKRVRVGGFVMPAALQPGQYMELGPHMLEKVFSGTRKSAG